jgi:hypothetical protein
MSDSQIGRVAASPTIRVRAVGPVQASSPVQPAGSPQAVAQVTAADANIAVDRARNRPREKGRLVDVEA